MQDFAPENLGPVTRPVRTEWCPRCQEQTWPGCETCPACGVVLAKARAVQSSVIRPPAPVIVTGVSRDTIRKARLTARQNHLPPRTP